MEEGISVQLYMLYTVNGHLFFTPVSFMTTALYSQNPILLASLPIPLGIVFLVYGILTGMYDDKSVMTEFVWSHLDGFGFIYQ